jgi:uncharacterized protein YkwD
LWVALAGVVLCVPLTAVAQQSMPPEQRLLQLLNQARIANGLNPLATTPELTASANAHARDMVQYGYMEHTARDGSTPQQRAARAGYDAPSGTAWLVLEVISARQTPEAAANWLLSDPLHRGVVLRNYFREAGPAYVQGGPYGQMWVVEFGCRPNVLPVVADPNPNGGMTVRLSNEQCTPTGRGDAIGKATEVQISDTPDFSGAVWEPFVTTKVVNTSGGNVFVRYRDQQGRMTMASAQGPAGNPVIVTAASASTQTLNMATPPNQSGTSQSAAPASTTTQSSAPVPATSQSAPPPAASSQASPPAASSTESPAAPASSSLFESKPSFVMQPDGSKP